MSDEYQEVNKDRNIVKFEEEGQAIEGEFVGYETIEGKEEIVDGKAERKTYEVAILKDLAGEAIQFFLSGVLRSKLKGIDVGNLIKVVYAGKKEVPKDVSQAGFVHDWKVFIKS